jgi:hypothetical protein
VATKSVCKAMLGYLRTILDPLYERIAHKYRISTAGCPEGTNSEIKETDLQELYLVLNYVGEHIHGDPMLFARLCRVMLEVVRPSSDDGKRRRDITPGPPSEAFVNVIADVLLPSLSLMQANVFLSEALWSVMKELPYSTRYMLYGYWLDSVYNSSPALIAKKCAVVKRTKDFRKSIVAGKKNQRIAKNSSKICSKQPLHCISDVIRYGEQV